MAKTKKASLKQSGKRVMQKRKALKPKLARKISLSRASLTKARSKPKTAAKKTPLKKTTAATTAAGPYKQFLAALKNLQSFWQKKEKHLQKALTALNKEEAALKKPQKAKPGRGRKPDTAKLLDRVTHQQAVIGEELQEAQEASLKYTALGELINNFEKKGISHAKRKGAQPKASPKNAKKGTKTAATEASPEETTGDWEAVSPLEDFSFEEDLSPEENFETL